MRLYDHPASGNCMKVRMALRALELPYESVEIALYAYVHCASDVGVDPRRTAELSGWLDRVEATEHFVNDLAPLPEYAAERAG